MRISSITPENRLKALFYYFGWQGGTIHQVSEVTGLTAHKILYGDHSSGPDEPSALTGGFSAIRTCDKQWRVERLAPKHQGDWPYWRDAILGYWATGALS